MYEHMDFAKINAFIAAAEHLNFTLAADSLFISQSALSKSIASLESTLGFPLFVRSNRKVSLTAEGAYLYHELKEIAAAATKAVENAKFMSKGYAGSFSIGTTGYMAKNPIFERISSQYCLEHPAFDIELHHVPYSDVRAQFAAGKYDMILSNQLNLTSMGGCRMLTLSPSKPILLCNPYIYDEYPSEYQTIRDFKNRNFICINQSADHLSYMTAACEAYGFRPKITRFADSIMEAVHYIGATGAVTIFDRTMFPMTDSDLKMIAIPPKDGMMRMDTVLIWKKESQNRPMLEYISFAQEILGCEIIEI